MINILSNISGYTASSIMITAVSYSNSSGVLNLYDNIGSTLSASGFYTGGTSSSVVITGANYSNGTLTLSNSTGGTITATGFYTGGTSTTDLIINSKITNLSSNQELGSDIITSGYSIYSIILQEVSGNNAGDISIGSTALGNDIINAETVNSNSTKKPPIGQDFFSLSSNQKIYISSSSWGSGNITFYLTLIKIAN
jgi:hypothetical protein